MKLNVGYFADGPWSHLAFNKLNSNDNIKINFICVRNDTKDMTLKSFCNEHGIDYLKYRNVNEKKTIAQLTKYNCDLFVSMSFNQIFSNKVISLPKLGTINCHAGKLPFYRGRNVINWALINDEKDFGITVHFVDEGIDTGDIILQEVFPITDEDNYSTILNKAYIECANILDSAIKLFIEDKKIPRIKQKNIHPVGFYCTQRIKGDEIINWNQNSRQIFNFIRAVCQPGPMSRSSINGGEISINRAIMVKDAPNYIGTPGAVISKDESGIIVKTLDSHIKVTEYYSDVDFTIGDRFEVR